MSIKSLYKDYFHKSKVFLYPALEIKRGGSVIAEQTYVKWDGYYEISDRKLICLYTLRDDEEFARFEKSKLIGNKLFHDFKMVDENKGIYVFDMNGLAEDFDLFIQGKYSQMSAEHKRRIKNFYGVYSSNYPIIESFLEPHKYYKIYSDLLNVNIDLLQKVGELCDPPDLEKESIDLSIKHITLNEHTL